MRRVDLHAKVGFGPSERGVLVALKFPEDSSVAHAVPLESWKHGTDAVHSL
jgi:hypothetical protein